MDFSSMSRDELENKAEEFFNKWQDAEHNAELYLGQLNKLKNDKFGKKSESINNLVEQQTLELFDEADELAVIDKDEEEKTEVKHHTRRKPKINAMDHLPDDIETETIIHDLDDKNCPKCGHEMHLIKTEIKKELKIIPRRKILVVHEYPVYGCRKCEKDGNCSIIKAEGPQRLFEKSPASIETVAYLMDAKFNFAVPLYRLEQNLKAEGILFPRATYARWMIDTAEKYLKPLYDYLHRQLLAELVIMADETYYDIFGEKGRKKKGKTYIWVYRTGPFAKYRIVLYQYEGGRKGTIPKSFLEGYSSYLSTDNYAGYNHVDKATRCLCHAHARRKYAEIIKSRGKKADDNSPEAKILKKYKAIFEEEKAITELSNGDTDKIKELRNSHIVGDEDISVKAKLDNMYSYMEEILPKTLKTSELYKALSYNLNNKKGFYQFLEDGHIPMTNNLCEQIIKPLINVRKNSLFLASPKGATGSATIMTIVQTAKMNNISPYEYLTEVLHYAVEHTDLAGFFKPTDEELEKLMPWNIKKANII
jgi:transposase